MCLAGVSILKQPVIVTSYDGRPSWSRPDPEVKTRRSLAVAAGTAAASSCSMIAITGTLRVYSSFAAIDSIKDTS
jgi:hypothetical protein